MPDMPKKVMLIGLDAPIPARVRMYAEQGHLPAVQALIKEGTWAENCLAPYPTITPPNWTTLATGAWPGTHGITCFNLHLPGDPLDKTHPAFNSRECLAEYIWTAAEREGKKSILLNYPSSWPSPLKDGVQVAGMALSLNEWRTPGELDMTLCHDQCFSTEALPGAIQIKLTAAEGWKNAPAGSMEAVLNVAQPRPRYRFTAPTWHLLLVREDGAFKRALICESKDASTAIADLRQGQWSEHIKRTFDTDNGSYPTAFALKLIELAPDASKLRLYMTPICALRGWTHPESLADELKSEKGLPLPYVPFPAHNLGWIDDDTWLELIESQHIWLADAGEYLLRNKPWEIFYMHAHCPDWVYHAFGSKWDPATNSDSREVQRYQRLELEFYKSLDRMIARILNIGGPECLVVLTSDHGAKASTKHFRVADVLEAAGLTVHEGEPPQRRVNWSKTKAVALQAAYIYVNLKGRDPDGSVPPEEYDAVRDEVIKALMEYTDPETGRKPIALALKREDARIMGLYGDRVGDVVYALSPHFGGQHGNLLPTCEFSLGSMRSLLVLKGPGVKKGHVLERNVWLTDIVPTMCYLADLPLPAQAEGCIIYQALEDPQAHRKELQELRENYARLKQAYEADVQLTHRYNEPK